MTDVKTDLHELVEFSPSAWVEETAVAAIASIETLETALILAKSYVCDLHANRVIDAVLAGKEYQLDAVRENRGT